MSLKFASQLNVDALPAEALNSDFEVIMPSLNIILQSASKNTKSATDASSFLTLAKESIIGSSISYNYVPVVEEIRFTPRSFKTETRRVRTQWVNVACDIENLKQVEIIMFCSNGMLTQYYLDAWRNLVYDKDGEYYNPISVYKKNIEVYFYGAASVGSFIPVAHFTLKGCFPVSQGSYDLKYSNKPDRLRISANFAVDRIVCDNTMARSSAIRELCTSPLSVANKLLGALVEGASDYSLSNTVD